MKSNCTRISKKKSKVYLKRVANQNLFLLAISFFFSNLFAQAPQPFYAPPTSSGVIEVKLYPMENVSTGVPTLVTFGIPFTRGSLLPGDISKVRVLTGSSSGSPEIPAYVKQVTPWRHVTNPAIDSQSVRIIRVQINHTFSASYPNYETIYVEYGLNNRVSDVATMQNPKNAWHTVTSGSFDATDNIQEPDVYAVLPKEYLSEGSLKLSRMLPLDNSVPLTREDPAVVNATTYPGYVEHDHAVHNFFFSIVNKDDPQVTVPNQNPYKTDYEPWLYDRTTTIYNLYMRSGNITALREAVRSAQFYKSQLYDNTTTPANAIGVFKLKVPVSTDYIGNNGAMYSYNEGLAYTYWLAADDDMLAPIHWVVNAHVENDPPTLWSPSSSSWTERFTAFNLLVNTVAYEVTGLSAYKNSMLTQANDFIWHQNGAGGQLPLNRIDGGLYHYGSQHGDGTPTSLLASSWMTVLIAEAMIRVYALSEDSNIANFVQRVGTFEKAALKSDGDHVYDSYSGPLWYSDYMMLYDGTTDERDGSEIEHSMEISVTFAWAAYFAALNGTPDASLVTAANRAYDSYDIGVNYWTRPAAPPLGYTAYRNSPWRKYGWQYTPSASFTWLMQALGPIGIGSYSMEPLKIYPNPTTDFVYIESPENQGTMQVSIFNMLGAKVFETELSQIKNQLNISQLPKGTYIIKASGKHGSFESKLIKD